MSDLNPQPAPVNPTPSAPPQQAGGAPPVRSARVRKWIKVGILVFGLVLGIYLLTAYAILPFAWGRYWARRHPALDSMPKFTRTAHGSPGDPLNVALIGTEKEIVCVMARAGWFPADERTTRSCMKIAYATLFKKEYKTAPVSDLFCYDRKQDLAFQCPMPNPRQRHHVRFWESAEKDEEERPLWIGAATFDDGLGITHATLQVTHHIDPDIDKERDKLLEDLEATGHLGERWLEEFHDQREGRNGGGHPYRTDGQRAVAWIFLTD